MTTTHLGSPRLLEASESPPPAPPLDLEPGQARRPLAPHERVLQLFAPVFVQDVGMRAAALEELEAAVRRRLHDPDAELFAPMLFRLATRCPLEDVRAAAADCYVALVDEGGMAPLAPPPPPSRFLDADALVPIDADLAALRSQFALAGTVDSATQILAWHPAYLDRFVETEAFLWRGGGALPLQWRLYLGIMAAAQLRARPLVQRLREEFLRCGGALDWLRGLAAVPAKLAQMAELNALLAAQPWRVSAEGTMAALLRGCDAGDECWSVAELAHACVLLVSTHALASFYAGVGVAEAAEVLGGADASLRTVSEDARGPPPPLRPLTPEGGGSAELLCEVDERRILELLGQGVVVGGGGGGGDGVEAAFLASSADVDEEAAAAVERPTSEFSRFGGEHADVRYTNFDVRSREYHVLHTENYSWQHDAFPLVDRLLPGSAALLDAQFTLTYNLTYNTYSDQQDIDTLPFRRAVWHYVMRLFGVCNDDYEYQEVNLVLIKPVKAYVRLVACLPYQVTADDFNSFSARLTPEERVHVNLLVMEARKQVGLLYAMRALRS